MLLRIGKTQEKMLLSHEVRREWKVLSEVVTGAETIELVSHFFSAVRTLRPASMVAAATAYHTIAAAFNTRAGAIKRILAEVHTDNSAIMERAPQAGSHAKLGVLFRRKEEPDWSAYQKETKCSGRRERYS